MLYIIYCKPEQNQGKKTFTKRLKMSFNIDAISKPTTREKPKDKDSIDINLIYLGDNGCRDENDFKKKYENENYFIYSRSGIDKMYYYAIKKSDITECFSSNISKVLICQDIEIVKDIHHFGKDKSSEIKAYCLIRSDDSNCFPSQFYLNEYEYGYLQEKAKKINEKIGKEITADELVSIFGEKLIKVSEEVDLNFFKNISYFDNLLIVPYCHDFIINYEDHCNEIDIIIEKYMELQPVKKQKRIFVIHPFTDKEGQVILPEMQLKFKKFLQVVFYEYLEKGYSIKFADEIQNSDSKQSPDYDLPPAIFQTIKNSSIIVCDLRYLKHNCFIEYGYTKGLLESGKNIKICLLYNESIDGNEKIFDVLTANKYYYEDAFFEKEQDYEDFIKIINTVQRKFGLSNMRVNISHELFGKFIDTRYMEITPINHFSSLEEIL